ncbi:sensor histidine kinase [Paenibacillus antarcticus]|uniref:HAMP domain-containing protein n=1 Tax=Paenibacillus antarcticus TaxID=253703 RepID=A0A162K8U3_9BACL|nr:sensor histidine kinase [Paenibacillus antarcticus]OAB44676.1 hypothetical protein PBAT_15560 [Paenibacillus antarcticus]
MKIRTSFFLLTMIVVALFLGCLIYYILRSYNQFVFEKISENAVHSTSQFTQNIDSLLQSYEQVTDFLFLNEDLQAKMLTIYSDFADTQQSYDDYLSPFTKSITGSRNIFRMTFFTENATYQFPNVKLINNDMKQSSWYQMMINNKLNNYWSYEGEDEYYHLNFLRLTQRLNKYKTDARLFVSLDINMQTIYNLIAKESKRTRFIVFLEDGTAIMDSFRQNVVGMKLQDYPFLHDNQQDESESQIALIDDQSYLITFQTINSRYSVRGMRVASLTPLDELAIKVNEMRRFTLILFIVFLLLFAVIIFSISYGFTKRLSILTDKMKQMNLDNLQILTSVKGKDEASILTIAYNRMVRRMERLIHDGYEMVIQKKELEIKTKESELYALQTQIHPHYLFNVLNAICGNLLEKGDRENARMVKLLAKSFRHLLGKSGQMIPLSDEIEIVDTYLNIQRFRFGERMASDIRIPENLMDMKVPKLILQTLVENAVVHGVENYEQKTTISIYARIVDEYNYQLIVQNDGPCIPKDRLNEIKEILNQGIDMHDSKHIGLRNVQDRIQKIFGMEYGLQIDSSDDKGTVVTACLPYAMRGGISDASGIVD